MSQLQRAARQAVEEQGHGSFSARQGMFVDQVMEAIAVERGTS